MEGQENQQDSSSSSACNSSAWVCIGSILAIGALAFAGWNEYRSVATTKTINAAHTSYVAVPCARVDPDNNGKLVYMACDVIGKATFNRYGPYLKGASMKPAVRLVSDVLVYQVVANTKTREYTDSSGVKKTETYYVYNYEWSPYYKGYQGNGRGCTLQYCQNSDPTPGLAAVGLALGYKNVVARAAVKLGDFKLPNDLIDKIGESKKRPVKFSCTLSAKDSTESNSSVATGGSNGFSSGCPVGARLNLNGEELEYYDGGLPKTSDGVNIKVKYYEYDTDQASIVAAQTPDGSFAKWTSPYDEDYYMQRINDGKLTVDQMIEEARDENFALTWIIRVLTYICVWAGFQMSFAPAARIGEYIPVFGECISGLLGWFLALFAFLVATFTWCLVVGATWVAYRPEIGGPLLGASGLALLISIWWRGRKSYRGNGGSKDVEMRGDFVNTQSRNTQSMV